MPFAAIPKHVLLAISALSGVLCIQVLPSLPPVWLWAICLGFSIVIIFRYAKFFALGVFLFFAAWAGAHADYRMQQRLPLSLVGEEVQVELRLQDLPKQAYERSQFDAEVLSSDRYQEQLTGRTLRLRWYGAAPALHAGSRWRMHIKLQDMRGSANTGGFDQEKYFLEQRIDGLGYIRDAGLAMQLERGEGIDAWRAVVAEQMIERMGTHRTRFIRAMSIGDTRDFTDEDWNILRVTGLGHLVAISGFHVGIVASAAVWLMYLLYLVVPEVARRIPRPQAMALAASISAFSYALMAGLSIATLRTAIMIAVISLCCLFRRAQSVSLSFSFALAAVLLFDPLSVLDAGFWLSFVGVACLLVSLPVTRIRLFSLSAMYLKAQWIAFVALFPFVLFFFSQNSWASPVINLIAIPLVSLILVPLCLITLAVLLLEPSWADPLLYFTGGCFEHGMHWLSGLQYWPVLQSHTSIESIGLFALLLLGVLLLLMPRGAKLGWAGGLCFLPIVFSIKDLPESSQLKITAFDFGRNQTVLVQSANHALLYLPNADSKSMRNSEELISLLHLHSVSKLDALVSTSSDPVLRDSLQQQFGNFQLITPQASNESLACHQIQQLNWDGAVIRFLHPPEYFPDRKNDSACVLKLETNHQSALITSGISKPLQQRLMNRYADQLESTVWVTTERNFERSVSNEFLQAIQPEQIWFSQRGREPAVAHPLIKTLSVRDNGELQAYLGSKTALETRPRRQNTARYWRSRLTN